MLNFCFRQSFISVGCKKKGVVCILDDRAIVIYNISKSLTKMLTNRGPKIVSCGTPLCKFIQSGSISFRTILCVNSLYEFSINMVACSSKPPFSILRNTIWCLKNQKPLKDLKKHVKHFFLLSFNLISPVDFRISSIFEFFS